MPTYEFRCGCGYEVSIMQRIDQTLTTPICAKCAEEMKRQYEVGAVKFNGKDFAINESKKGA
jgi:putative FmdB family regulatory protein